MAQLFQRLQSSRSIPRSPSLKIWNPTNDQIEYQPQLLLDIGPFVPPSHDFGSTTSLQSILTCIPAVSLDPRHTTQGLRRRLDELTMGDGNKDSKELDLNNLASGRLLQTYLDKW